MDAQGANHPPPPPPPGSQASNGSASSSGNDGGSIDAGEGHRSRRGGSGHPRGDKGAELLDSSSLNAR